MKINGYEIKPFADLEGADLRNANLKGAILSHANLSHADLYRADLRGAILEGADLRGADLEGANLKGANLEDADLWGASLRGADLRNANLRGADLEGADLRNANLRGAILEGAILYRTNLEGANLPHFQIPQYGGLTVFKALKNGLLAKLEIPAEAKRTACLISRKCRAEYVKVLEIFDREGKTYSSGQGWKDSGFIYERNLIAYPDSYDDDIRVECTHGVHFFLTLEEALEWCS